LVFCVVILAVLRTKAYFIQVKFGVPMGASHGIGHQLGPLGMGHGETSCVLLPSVLKYNYLHGNQAVKGAQKKVVAVFWEVPTIATMLRERGLNRETADAGDLVGALVSELGMPRTLRDVGVTRDKLDALAENSMKDRCMPTNPIPLTEKAQVLEILATTLGD
jgi:alcohol dehydrogenase class IV